MNRLAGLLEKPDIKKIDDFPMSADAAAAAMEGKKNRLAGLLETTEPIKKEIQSKNRLAGLIEPEVPIVSKPEIGPPLTGPAYARDYFEQVPMAETPLEVRGLPEKEGGIFRGHGATARWDPVGSWEKLKDVDVLDVITHLPGSALVGLNDIRKKIYKTAKYQLETGDYGPTTRYGMTPMGGYMPVRAPATKEGLQKIVDEYEQKESRGETTVAAIMSGIADLPAYMGEMYAGGIGEVKSVPQALLFAGKIMPIQFGRIESSLEDKFKKGDKGYMALAKAMGDVYIENLSETAGAGFPAVARRLPFGGKLVDALHDFARKTGISDSEFWKRMGTKVGYNGLLGEWGEERLATFLKALFNIEDYDAGPDSTMDERIFAGLAQDLQWQNQAVELGVLSAPGAAKQVGKIALGRKEPPPPTPTLTTEAARRMEGFYEPPVEPRITPYEPEPVKAKPEEVSPITDIFKRLEEARRKAEEKLGRKVTKARAGKAEGPLVAQLFTQMEDLLEQVQAERDFDKRNAILDSMEKIDNIIGQLSRENLESKDITQLHKMAKRFGVEIPKGADKETIIGKLAGRADFSQIQKTPTGYQIRIPIADKKAGRGWETHEFDTFAEAAYFLESREEEGGAPAIVTKPKPKKPIPTEEAPPITEAAEKEVPTEEIAEPELKETKKYPVQEVPVEDLTISKDVPQFKEEAIKETGVIPGQELQGRYERLGTGNIVVWERENGDLEVITGRHRLDLAKRTGEKTIPAQIVRESEGFTRVMALTLDAERNIMDGQGSVRDYVQYFKNTEITEDEARARGLLARAKGKTGFRIGKSAVDDVYTAYINGKISEAKAYAIANGAPNNQAAQIAALQKADSKSADELEQYARILSRYEAKPISGKQGDLFGYDDSAIKEAEAVAAEVAKEVKSVKERILAVKGALRRPETARQMGLEFTDEPSLRKEVERLENRLDELSRVSTTPELYEEMRKRAGLEGKPVPTKAEEAPAEEKRPPLTEMRYRRRNNLIAKMVQEKIKDFSDSELDRVFKGTAAEQKNIEEAKELIRWNWIELDDVLSKVREFEKQEAEEEKAYVAEEEAAKKRVEEKAKGAEKKPVSESDRKRAKRLRIMADNLDKHIEDKRRGMTQNPTPKRMREYYSRLHDADNMERTQKAMRAMADALEKGELPNVLEDVKSKADIARLVYKGTLPGGYYEVIPDDKYRVTSEAGKTLQRMIEKAERKPTVEEADKEVLINEILTLSRNPMPQITEVFELKGTDGKWYRPQGFPIGVDYVGEKRLVGFAYVKDGVTYGTRADTKQELIDRFNKNEDKKADDFRKELEKMPFKRVQEQAEFWRKESRRRKGLLPEKPAPAKVEKKEIWEITPEEYMQDVDPERYNFSKNTRTVQDLKKAIRKLSEDDYPVANNIKNYANLQGDTARRLAEHFAAVRVAYESGENIPDNIKSYYAAFFKSLGPRGAHPHIEYKRQRALTAKVAGEKEMSEQQYQNILQSAARSEGVLRASDVYRVLSDAKDQGVLEQFYKRLLKGNLQIRTFERLQQAYKEMTGKKEAEVVPEKPTGFITDTEKDELRKLGYTVPQILNMTPEQARANIQNRTPEIRKRIKEVAPKLTDAQVDGILALWTANAKVNNMTLPEWIDKNIADLRAGVKPGKKAAIQFMRDGRAIITAFENADVSSFIHETGHIFRRMMSAEDDAIIRKAFNITSWDTAAEEKFARAFERYIYEGKAPSPEVRGIFNKLAEWLREIYQNIMAFHPLNINISPEVRNVFDNFIRKDTIEHYGRAREIGVEGRPAVPGPARRTGERGRRASAAGTVGYIKQPEAREGVEQPAIPTGRSPVIQNKKEIPTVDKEIVDDILNKYGGPRDSTLYQADQGPALDEHQIFGISLALKAVGRGDSFILADGTGFGKTRQCIVVAHENQQRTKKPSLIVTQNKEIIKTIFERQAKILGIDLSKIEVGTYHGLNSGKIGNKKYGVVIFDESHNLKNFESGRSLAARQVNTDTKLFVTATPMDKHTSAAYFLSEISGVSMEDMMNRLGFHIETRTDPYTGKTMQYTVTNENVSWADVIDNIIDMRDQAIRRGTYLRREMPFKGVVRPFEIAMPNDFRVRQDDIYGYWEYRIKRTRSREKKMRLGQLRSGELSRFTESQKVRPVLQAVLNDLKNGEKIIVVAEGIKPTEIKALHEVVPGFIGSFTRELKNRNIKYAAIYGGGNKAKQIDAFQNDEVQIAVMTPQSGGTGIDLDDTIGNNPRKMYIVSMSWAGDQFEQNIGRISRRNTKSDSEVRIVQGRSISDDKRMATAGRKLRTLTAIQKGEDLDRSGGIEVIDENGDRQILYQDESKPWEIEKLKGEVRDEKLLDIYLKGEQRDKDLLGREELRGGAAGEQMEMFDKENFLTLEERKRINAKRDIEGQGTLFQEETPIWYSKLEYAVVNKMPNKMKSDDFRNWTKKQGGIKDEEMLWSGVDELLSKQDTVTKQEILDTIRENNVQIEEVVKGGTRAERPDITARDLHQVNEDLAKVGHELEDAFDEVLGHLESLYTTKNEKLKKYDLGPPSARNDLAQRAVRSGDYGREEQSEAIDKLKEILPDYDAEHLWSLAEREQELRDEADEIRAGIRPGGIDTRFQQYTLPGGTNYREVLLRLPVREEQLKPKSLEQWYKENQGAYGWITEWENLSDKAKEGIKKHYEDEAGGMFLPRETRRDMQYQSPHWAETNVLAHFRITDRTDKEGNDILFIEEIQSDWHQRGREKGYRGKEYEKQKEKVINLNEQRTDVIKELNEKHNIGARQVANDATSFYDRNREVDRDYPNIGYVPYRGGAVTDEAGWGRVTIDQDMPAEVQQLIEKYASLTRQWYREEVKTRQMETGVPEAPFKTTWHELAFKRILRMAAEEGYDKVAWTTGEQQAERYDLSQQVDGLVWDEEDGTIYVRRKGANAYNAAPIAEGVTRDKLADYVGKEAAQKLAEAPVVKSIVGVNFMEGDVEGTHELTGVDLKIGGKGMIGFYDKMLPAYVKKYTKKFGVKGVGETLIQTEKETIAKMSARDIAEKSYPLVHSIPVTESMKSSVLEGQPLYQSEELTEQDKENIIKTFNMARRHGGKKLRREVVEQVEKEKKAELRKRVGKLAALQKSKRGNYENTIFTARAALPGELTEYTRRYEAIRDKLSPDVIDSCFKSIQVSNMRPLQIDNTAAAFQKFIDGSYLTMREVGLIYKHFGPQWGRIALRQVPSGDRIWLDLMEAMNIPRTMLASFDMSGILRQARPLGQAHPKEYAKMMKGYWKAFWSHDAAMKLEAATIADPFYEEAKGDGILELVEWGETVPEMIERAERFGGAGIIERAAEVPIAGVPLKPVAAGVRASERSFVTALNWMRMAVYSKIRTEQEKSGKKISLSERKALANRINDLTGRSHIKRTAAARSLAPFMQALFSPRFTISRFKPIVTLPKDAITSMKDGKLRSELSLGLTALTSLMLTNFLIMFVLKFFDDEDKIKIETDLQSSDGGKIRVGISRFDLWSGYLQPAQLLVRLATGQRKTQAGNYIDVSRGELLETFGRSKANPIVGLVIDAYTGRTFYGGRFGGPPKGRPGEIMTKYDVPEWLQGVGKEVWNRIVPLAIQDTADALVDDGIPMAITAGTFSFLGGGAQTYPMWSSTQLRIEQNKQAQTKYKKPWNELSERQQENIMRMPRLKKLKLRRQQEKKYEGPPRIDWMIEEQDKISRQIYKKLPDNVQSKMDELGLKISAPNRYLGDWYLNDKRYDFYIKETTENMIKIFKKGVPKNEKIFRARMNLAKEKARIQLRKMVRAGKI